MPHTPLASIACALTQPDSTQLHEGRQITAAVPGIRPPATPLLSDRAHTHCPPPPPLCSNNLDLDKQDISGASIATVTGAVFSRILLGAVCDSYGPRYGHGVLQLLCSAATFGIAAITNAGGFIACRM